MAFTSAASTAASTARDRLQDVVQSYHRQHSLNGSQTMDTNQTNSTNVTSAYNLKDGVESLLRTMFAPCAGISAGAGAEGGGGMGGGIGGVPRDEIGGMEPPTSHVPQWSGNGASQLHPSMGNTNHNHNNNNNNTNNTNTNTNKHNIGTAREGSVPFEVATRTRSDLSRDENDVHGRNSPHSHSHNHKSPHGHGSPSLNPNNNKPSTPLEQKQANALSKLRQLGAQHQLASGVHGEMLADVARPVSPERGERVGRSGGANGAGIGIGGIGGGAHAIEEEAPDLIDFDDGISAISAHTLEDMERRGLIHGHCHHSATGRNRRSQIPKKAGGRGSGSNSNNNNDDGSNQWARKDFFRIDETKEVLSMNHGLNGQEVGLFEDDAFANPFRRDGGGAGGGGGKSLTKGPQEQAIKSDNLAPIDLSRGPSTNTRGTTSTEETNGELWLKEEARYWDTVAKNETRNGMPSRQAINTGAAGEGNKSSRSRKAARSMGRPSVEDRARRLRELSRSRSRSDGTGSSKKSASSPTHPHDTVPVFASDVVSTKKSSANKSRTSPRSFVPGSFEDDVFPALDYGEI